MKPKPINVAEFDQAQATVLSLLVPHWAAVFLAFTKQEGISRAEAMQLTTAMIQTPPGKGS